MTPAIRVAGLQCLGLPAVVLTVLLSGDVFSRDDKPATLDGAWTLAERKLGGDLVYNKLPAGLEMTKIISGGRFVWTVVSHGQILAAAGGKCTVKNDTYTESVDAVHGEGQALLLGKRFDFTWTIEGNTWHHAGTLQLEGRKITIDEKWERSK